MQRPTSNDISQTQHTIYKAVDYSANPDPIIYAPEDGKITLIDTSGSCGKRMWMVGKTGRSGFCHIETYYVKLGQSVKRGQKLAKMGYTGYTIPSGPGGRHLHQVLYINGVYVYPPSKVNQSFIKLGDEVKPTKKITFSNRRNYAFTEDTYIVTIPGNKKAGTILHRRGEVIDVGEYTEWPDGKKFYRTKKQVADKDQRGYGKSKLTRIETAKISKVTF